MNLKDRLENERRVGALRRTGALDSGPEKAFDQISRLAAQMLRAPSAFISLIGSNRHYIKSSVGDGTEGVDSFERDVSLDISFCKYVVASGQQFVVDDARENDLVRNNEAVRRGVIAYAGVPFHAEGETIGALCVVDSHPRHWTDEDLEQLNSLARSVEHLLTEPTGGQDASPECEDRLLAALRLHLRAVDEYRSVIAQPAKKLDLAAERAAREEVDSSSDILNRQFRDCSGQLRGGLDRLVIDLRLYVGAEERRRKAADEFSAGSGRLDALQSAISEVTLAEEQLRVALMDAGVQL